MGMTTFAIANLFFSFTARDELRSVFSLDTFNDRTFLIDVAAVGRRDHPRHRAALLPAHPRHRRADRQPVADLHRRRAVDRRRVRAVEALPAAAGRAGEESGSRWTCDPALGVANLRRRLRRAERRLARAHRAGRGERRDLPALARQSDAVKVRDGRLDVKRLEAVDDEGLQQWAPVMKAAFPLAAGEARRCSRRWAFPRGLGAAPPRSGDRRRRPGVSAVPMNKRRAHYTYGGCLAEITELRTGGRRRARSRSSPRTRHT